jgi:hypothetical protein
MSLGSDTGVVNGQRFTFPTTASYLPMAYGPQTTGVPNVSPTMPPFIGGTGGATSGIGFEGVGGYGTAGNNQFTTGVAASHPFDMRLSPVLWAVLGLVLALVLLKGIHWRETTLAGFSEHGEAGPFSEGAEARAT